MLKERKFGNAAPASPQKAHKNSAVLVLILAFVPLFAAVVESNTVDSFARGLAEGICIYQTGPVSRAQSVLTKALQHVCPPTDTLSWFQARDATSAPASDHHCGREGGKVIECGA